MFKTLTIVFLLMAGNGKIGYAMAADVAQWPEVQLGDMIFYDLDHFTESSQSFTVADNGAGLALFTRNSHGLSVNSPVDIDAGNYTGHWLVHSTPSANTTCNDAT